MKRLGFAVYDLYNFFFNAKINPLRHMPNAYTQYLLMFYLSVMWTAVFTLWTAAPSTSVSVASAGTCWSSLRSLSPPWCFKTQRRMATFG